MTLYELLNDAFKQIEKDKELKEIIEDDKESLLFINNVFRNNNIGIEIEDENINTNIAQIRARHSVINYLMGCAFMNHFSIKKEIMNVIKRIYTDKEIDKIVNLLWLLTALNHDYGYYCKDFNNYDLNIDNLLNETNLFDESDSISCNITAYSKDELKEYLKYKKAFAKGKKESDVKESEVEYIDHGILGGIRTFKKLCRNKNNDIYNNIYKIACKTITYHNLYKFEEFDDDYQLLSTKWITNKFCIDITYPLLLLLSLVDSFECVKKFSKGEVGSKNFHHTLTVLNNIDVELKDNEIIVNYEKFTKVLNPDSKNNFNSYINALENINYWTKLSFYKCDENLYSFRYIEQ